MSDDQRQEYERLELRLHDAQKQLEAARKRYDANPTFENWRTVTFLMMTYETPAAADLGRFMLTITENEGEKL